MRTSIRGVTYGEVFDKLHIIGERENDIGILLSSLSLGLFLLNSGYTVDRLIPERFQGFCESLIKCRTGDELRKLHGLSGNVFSAIVADEGF